MEWNVYYNEEYNNIKYVEPLLWTKETTTAGFILAFKVIASTIYGNEQCDIDVIPRFSTLKSDITFNTTSSSEQTNIDSGFTSNNMVQVISKNGSNINLTDNSKVICGDGPDLEIYHDGSNSLISDTGTGDLVIEATNLRLRSKVNEETYILCTEDGSVELYHDNSKKLETTSTGITVTGTINGNISGNAGSVTNGIYTTSSVTDLSDVSSVGSGAIITSTERTKLNNIEENADITDATNVMQQQEH